MFSMLYKWELAILWHNITNVKSLKMIRMQMFDTTYTTKALEYSRAKMVPIARRVLKGIGGVSLGQAGQSAWELGGHWVKKWLIPYSNKDGFSKIYQLEYWFYRLI